MNSREKRIRILDLQDQYCMSCESRMKPLKTCISHCEVGEELKQLGTELSPSESRNRIKTKPKVYRDWEELIPKVVGLKQEGYSLYQISLMIDCSLSVLKRQMKMRELQ
ncbi:zinc-finger domain-containing protein [Bacillus sp. C30]|uniref:zinc-finger domain-containing protein n=1 Tax=Bacillus sp. C30 TaxID=1387733 RepID=UPI00349F453B